MLTVNSLKFAFHEKDLPATSIFPFNNRPHSTTRGSNHTPDGLPVCAARIAEGKKEDSYAALDKTSHAFLPLAFDVFCGTAPRADEFLRRLASIVVELM